MTSLNDTQPSQPVIAYISIGSNIDPEANLRQAVALLRERAEVEVLALSAVYQSPAYGFADQPDFLDVVAKVQTMLTPEQFKHDVLDDIERHCGRDRASQINKDGPLTMDMDILLWGDTAFEFGSKPWRVPNKGITKFAAVAIPLAELAPDVVHPVEGMTIQQIASRFENAEDVQRLAWGID
jgi:2-amino-4-hydroxy-6-hydroxymethyldihydropteridine diphosphokinase